MVKLSNLRAAGMAALGAGMVMLVATPVEATRFKVTNLVSDGFVPAPTIDPNLVNPWGIAYGPTGPFWTSNNGTGTSTLYNGAGAKLALTVAIPDPANPTGIVFNGGGGFNVTDGAKTGSSAFIFATEGGTLVGWAPSVSLTNSFVAVDNSVFGPGAIYKGLAIGSSGGASYIYATDFHNGVIEQFDSNFNLVRSFTDPGVDAGYAPFGAQVLGGELYVTYALQDDDKHDDVAGAGHGYVDVFNLDGSFSKRLVSAGGAVDSPWGMVIAPSSFGWFAGDLLVGNFGDGTISAFDPVNGAFRGALLDLAGNPIIEGDLWGLIGGNGAAGGDLSKVYFTAGVVDEAHGLFGSITAVPEPATWALMLLGFAMVGVQRRRSGAAHPTR
jgi:uncharacterized protein (TIGR03118 family)